MNGSQFSVRYSLSTTVSGSIFDNPFTVTSAIPIIIIRPKFGSIRIDRISAQTFQTRDYVYNTPISTDGHRLALSAYKVGIPTNGGTTTVSTVSDYITNTGIDDKIDTTQFELYDWNFGALTLLNAKDRIVSTVGVLPSIKLYEYISRIKRRCFISESEDVGFGIFIENPFQYSSLQTSNFMLKAEAMIEFSIV